MKKLILAIFLLTSINLYASDKTKCENLFKSAIYNFYLENTCKFNKGLSSTIRKDFENIGCSKLFNDADMKKLNSEVLGSSYNKMKKMGRDNFCNSSIKRYKQLVSSYKD